MISPIDPCIVLAAVLALARVARRPRPVHPATAVLMALLTAAWLWANLRPTAWQQDFAGGEAAPPGLDPVTTAMFWRGWPLAPFMVCLVQGLRFRPGGLEGGVLVLDAALFLVALYAAKAACERLLLRWRRGDLRIRTGGGRRPRPAGGDPAAGPAGGVVPD